MAQSPHTMQRRIEFLEEELEYETDPEAIWDMESEIEDLIEILEGLGFSTEEPPY